MERIGIIGFGNMGEAFARGLQSRLQAADLVVVEKLPSRLSVAKEQYGARDCTGNWEQFFSLVSTTILAVKPQDADSLLQEIAPFSRGRGFISIMAGKSLQLLGKHLQTSHVARFMPNLAATYGKAAVGVAFLSAQEGGFRDYCLNIAKAVGQPVEIPERIMAGMTGLSGSGIAFVFHFIHALALGGVKVGLNYSQAVEIALQVVEGAVEVLRKTEDPPSTWITKVASPAGTTIEGLKVLEESGVTAAIMDAIEAASRRATELEGGNQ